MKRQRFSKNCYFQNYGHNIKFTLKIICILFLLCICVLDVLNYMVEVGLNLKISKNVNVGLKLHCYTRMTHCHMNRFLKKMSLHFQNFQIIFSTKTYTIRFFCETYLGICYSCNISYNLFYERRKKLAQASFFT